MNIQRLTGWQYSVWLALLCVGISITGLAGEAGTTKRIGMGEVKGGELLFRTDEAGIYDPAIHLETDVDIEVNGMVASVVVEQRFRNPGSGWVHGIYAFPLPDDSAVNAMRIEIGERVIVGEIHEKHAAKKEFEAAKKAGKKAALVEQQRPNMFRSSVANIPPGEEVSVTISYLQKVDFRNGRFSIRFPMTITPRYVPGTPLPRNENRDLVANHGWAIATDQVPDAAEITPLLSPLEASIARSVNIAKLSARLNPGLPLADVSSAYHQIHVVRDKDRYDISLHATETSMDRDFELSWMPTRSAVPQAALFTETRGGEDYAMLMLVPPQQLKELAVIPREVIFVIDRSGSMSGESIRQARKALLFALARLTPADSFNIIQFDDTAQALFPAAQLATPDKLEAARRFATALESGGGTEMARAIELALDDHAVRESGSLRQVIFVTDGAVGNEDALYALIKSKLGNSRLFTVGIGSAPNSYFMRKAAAFGRGTFTYIGDAHEVAEKIQALFDVLASPTLRDIQLNWPVASESFPVLVPDLYAGEPIVVTAKLAEIKGKLAVSARMADRDWLRNVRLSSIKHSTGVAALWARDKIDWWEDQIILNGESDKSRNGILSVALDHQLMSRYTSFLAVEKTPSRPTGNEPATKGIPNARPAGQGLQSFAFPQTALGGPQSVLLGCIALCGWLVANGLLRRTKGGSC